MIFYALITKIKSFFVQPKSATNMIAIWFTNCDKIDHLLVAPLFTNLNSKDYDRLMVYFLFPNLITY